MQTYQAYIPTHFRGFVFAKRYQPPNQEAELEDAIINRYYRKILSLINMGVLLQTTHYFTCSDTPETRVHHAFPLMPDGEYDYIDPEVLGATKTRTNHVKNYAASLVEHMALQMVGRYGDIKSYRIIEPHIRRPPRTEGDYIVFNRQIVSACQLAIRRDEIELFNALRAHNKYGTGAVDIIEAQSTVCIEHFLSGVSENDRAKILHEGQTNLTNWAEIICYRRRMDLTHKYVSVDQRHNIRARHYAIQYGFVELLDEIHQANPIDSTHINQALLYNLERSMKKDAIVSIVDWIFNKGYTIPRLADLIGYNKVPSPELIQWYIDHNSLSEPDIFAVMTCVMLLIDYSGFPSVEYNDWKACVEKMISLGISIPVVPPITTTNRRFAEAANGVGGLRVRFVPE